MECDRLELRQSIIDCCLWMVKEGLVIGTWGNVSVRMADGNILITPSRLAYEEMRPEDLVVLAPDGTQLCGTRLPTSERDVHRGILNRRPDINAIIHAHSAYAMAAAALEGGIPPISEEMCQVVGGAIPLSSRFVPSERHEELGEVVAASLGDANAVLIRNHGPVCCGATLEDAKTCCQVVEKSAKMFLHLQGNQKPLVVEEPWVTAGRLYYTKSYGKT